MIPDKTFLSKTSYFLEETHVLKLAISSGNHLGFAFEHPIRKNDSFEAFEEILKKSREINVDFLLLAGNLSEEARPSQEILCKTMNVFKENIMGNKCINFEISWDNSSIKSVNYASENINIDLPVFAIQGKNELSSDKEKNILDVLHDGNYLNFLGKCPAKTSDFFEISPIFITKGETKVAIYAIGYMRDSVFEERWTSKRFKFLKSEETESYFNILIIHQNPSFPLKITEESSFFSLIINGFCNKTSTKLELLEENNMFFYKSGCSVVTKIQESDEKPKNFAVLAIRAKEMQFEQIPLKESQRDVLFKELFLNDLAKFKDNREENLLENKKNFKGFAEDELEFCIEQQIVQLLKEFQQRNFEKEVNKLPLLRIKVEYSGFDVARIQRIENKFLNKVANQGEILQFVRKRNDLNLLETCQNNLNLNENFVDCFRNKISFNTLGKESLTSLRQIYEKDLSNHRFNLINSKPFLDKIDQMSFRSRNLYLTEFFSEILSKISKELCYDYKSELISINSKYSKKSQYILKKFRATFASAIVKRQSENRKEPVIISQEIEPVEPDEILDNFDYSNEVQAFFQKILKEAHLIKKAANFTTDFFKDSNFEKEKIAESSMKTTKLKENFKEIGHSDKKSLKNFKELSKILEKNSEKKRGRPKKEQSSLINEEELTMEIEKNTQKDESNQKKRKMKDYNSNNFMDFLKNKKN